MIIAVVSIPWKNGERPDNKAWYGQALTAADSIYRDVKGLLRKDFISGEEAGGGIYLFDSRENALAWFNDGWADWMTERFGVRPTLTLYDHVLALDNSAGEIQVRGKRVDPAKTDAAE